MAAPAYASGRRGSRRFHEERAVARQRSTLAEPAKLKLGPALSELAQRTRLTMNRYLAQR